MNVNLTTDKYDIISTGSVIIPSGEFIEFQIENLKFRFSFEIDDNVQEPQTCGRITTSVRNEGTPDAYMLIAIYNLNNSVFASPQTMLSLASLGNRDLFVKFSIQSINRQEDQVEDKIFFYTWYLKKELIVQPATQSSSPQE